MRIDRVERRDHVLLMVVVKVLICDVLILEYLHFMLLLLAHNSVRYSGRFLSLYLEEWAVIVAWLVNVVVGNSFSVLTAL